MTLLARLLILLAFFFSGLAALLYEVLFAKGFQNILGASSYAQALVLMTYMGGLGLGVALGGYVARRTERHILVYALLELAIGLWGLAYTPLMWLADALVTWTFTLDLGANINLFLKFLITGLILSPGSVLMGMTFPLLVTGLTRAGGFQRWFSLLYGVNTIGAAAGALLADFWFIPVNGLSTTAWIAASFNIFAFALSLISLVWMAPQPEQPVVNQIRNHPAKIPRLEYEHLIILSALFLLGFSSMCYEVYVLRYLSLVFSPSVYCYSLVLSLFVLGLGLGGLASNLFRTGKSSWTHYLAFIQIAIALHFVLASWCSERVVLWFIRVIPLLTADVHRFWTVLFVVSMFLVFTPAFLSGLSFTVLSGIHGEKLDYRNTDWLPYLVNSAGSFTAPPCVLFLMLPGLGLLRTIQFLSMLYLSISILILLFEYPPFRSPNAYRRPALIILLLFMLGLEALWFPLPDSAIVKCGAYFQGLRSPCLNLEPDEIRARLKEDGVILFDRDGLTGTVQVLKHDQNMFLKIGGKVDASTGKDMSTQLLLAHIPMMMRDSAENVLIIGLGSGITSSSILSYPVQSLVTVELSGDVIDGVRRYFSQSATLFTDPRSRVVCEDAYYWLKSSRSEYSIIVSEPSNPWMTGTGRLFSQEFYKIVRECLAKDGVFCQWFHSYDISLREVFCMIKTMHSVFPESHLFMTSSGDIAMVGWKDLDRHVIPLDNYRSWLKRCPTLAVLDEMGMSSELWFQTSYIGPSETIANVAFFSVPDNTIDHPFLEYSAPISFLTESESYFQFILFKAGYYERWTDEMLTRVASGGETAQDACVRALGFYRRLHGPDHARPLDRRIRTMLSTERGGELAIKDAIRFNNVLSECLGIVSKLASSLIKSPDFTGAMHELIHQIPPDVPGNESAVFRLLEISQLVFDYDQALSLIQGVSEDSRLSRENSLLLKARLDARQGEFLYALNYLETLSKLRPLNREEEQLAFTCRLNRGDVLEAYQRLVRLKFDRIHPEVPRFLKNMNDLID